MKQIGRRLAYSVFGFLPAFGVAFSAFTINGLMNFFLGSLIGTIGFAWAALVLFPLPTRKFQQILLWLLIGIATVLWFSTIAVREMFVAMHEGRMDTGAHGISLFLAAVVALIGPAACLAHFIKYSRHAPN